MKSVVQYIPNVWKNSFGTVLHTEQQNLRSFDIRSCPALRLSTCHNLKSNFDRFQIEFQSISGHIRLLQVIQS